MTVIGRSMTAAACLAAALSPVAADAAEATGYAVLTSDYVFRGVGYSDNHPALQVGVDVSLDNGLYAGFWGSTIDVRSGPTHRELEMNYYAGYGHDLTADWTIGANIAAFSFPGTEGPIDYDYREYSVIANFRDRAWLEYSYSPDLFNTSRHSHNLEIYGEWPLPKKLLLGLGAGYYDVSALSGVGYGYWQLGITRPFSRFSIDLRYHDTSRYAPIVSSPERAESRVALSFRIPFAIAGK